MSKQGMDRRSFLKGAAVSAAAVIGTQIAATNAAAQLATPIEHSLSKLADSVNSCQQHLTSLSQLLIEEGQCRERDDRFDSDSVFANF